MKDNADKVPLEAKLQYFADYMNQTILEKETLSISLGQCDLTDEIQKEIELYQKFMDKYEEIFKEILYR